MTARLLLVRHGESQWNAEGRVQGHDGPGLTETGLLQARSVVTRLQPWSDRDGSGRFGLLAQSDLPRVRETAAPIAQALGPGVRVLTDERLREAHLGRWEGRLHAEIDEADLAAWRRTEEVDHGGETRLAFRERVVAALSSVADAALEVGRGAVVVTHGGCVRAFGAWVAGLELDDAWHFAPVRNASVSTFARRDGAWRLLSYGDVGHLLPLA